MVHSHVNPITLEKENRLTVQRQHFLVQDINTSVSRISSARVRKDSVVPIMCCVTPVPAWTENLSAKQTNRGSLVVILGVNQMHFFVKENFHVNPSSRRLPVKQQRRLSAETGEKVKTLIAFKRRGEIFHV